MAEHYGRDRVLAWQRALNDAVDEVIDVAAPRGHRRRHRQGRHPGVARNPAAGVAAAARARRGTGWGVRRHPASDERRSGPTDSGSTACCRPTTPRTARASSPPSWRGVSPTSSSGSASPSTSRRRSPQIEPGRAVTALRHGTARPIVLRATEGFTARMPGLRRRWLPMNSSMIATDPLPEDVWASIGWEGRETARRHRARLLLRAAHRRRPHRDRRPQRAVPVRVAHRRRRPGARRHHHAT